MELCNLRVDFTYESRNGTRKLKNDGLIFDAGSFGEYWKPVENDEIATNAAEVKSKLQEAIQRHDIELLQLLLTPQEPCKIDALDEHGIGAIHYTARHGFLEGMCIIIAFRGTIDLRTRSGSTALHIAIRLILVEAVQTTCVDYTFFNRKLSFVQYCNFLNFLTIPVSQLS